MCAARSGCNACAAGACVRTLVDMASWSDLALINNCCASTVGSLIDMRLNGGHVSDYGKGVKVLAVWASAALCSAAHALVTRRQAVVAGQVPAVPHPTPPCADFCVLSVQNWARVGGAWWVVQAGQPHSDAAPWLTTRAASECIWSDSECDFGT
eukprot:jgi/Ulvmu1/4951/UM206_0003.1